MRKNWLAMALVCLLLMAHGQADATMTVRAESPQAASGPIPLNTDFSVDIWIDSDVNVPGGGFSFSLYGTDGLTDVSHLAVGNDLYIPSIEYLNSFDTYFGPNLIFPEGNGFNGALPDSINFSFLTFGAGLPGANVDQPYIRFHMNSSQNGTLCIDSCTNDSDPDWEWLFVEAVKPVTFNGPYCFTIGDPNPPPVITCPSDQTVMEGEELTFNVTATDPDGTTPAMDVLTSLPPGAGYAPNQDGTGTFVWTPDCDDIGTYPITFIAVDEMDEGLTDECTVTITVTADAVAPVITCPEDITVGNDAGICGAVVNFEVTATDNCPGVTVETDAVSGSTFPVGVTLVSATATDADGNTAQCTFNITVNDTEEPSVTTFPEDITIGCDESTDPAVTGEMIATDNCDTDVLISYTDIVNGNVITRSWVATDDAGNTAPYDQIITIVDETAPVVTCPADLTILCTDTMDPEFTGFGTAEDNCDLEVDITFVDVETPGACPQEMVVTRTWTATDDAGNSSSCDQIITVVDNEAPAITCPDNVTIPFDGSTDPAETGTATATDNCGTTIDITYADITVENVITRTWTATDECGNASSCDQVITIQGSGSPVITCPDDVTVACDASTDPAETGTATATDDNDPNPTVTFADVITEGDCAFNYTIARTWTAEDLDGNTSSCVQTITVVDDVAPVLTCPADIAVDCNGSTDPAETGTATATDNCDDALTVSYADVAEAGVITRTWTATDACGNAATCDQIITIEDNVAPLITECAADITVTCVGDTLVDNTGTPVFTDDCDPEPALTWASVVTEGPCQNQFSIERTFTVTDNAGNSTSCVQTITVMDDILPVITCPDNLEIPWNGSTHPDETGFATATDNCDGDVTVTYEDESIEGVIGRTWTATDVCGNAATCVQSITMLPMPDPALEADPMSFNLSLVEGEMLNDIAVDISEILDRNVEFSIWHTEDWLSLDDMFPLTTPATITFDIDATLLTFGTYYDTLRVTSPEAEGTQIHIALNVEPAVAPPDSVWVSRVPGVPGNHITVPVYFRNNDELSLINLPLEWSNNALTLDSVSFVGTRVEFVDDKTYIHNDDFRQVEITIDPTFVDPIPAGRGLLAKLHFKVYDFIPDLPVTVDIYKTTIGMDGHLFFEDLAGNEIIPVFTPGGAVINEQSGETCGRVVDIFGNEIEGATVELWDDFPAGALMTSMETDINGQFGCGSLGIFPFDAYAHKAGYYPGLVEDIEYHEIGFDIVLTPVEGVHESPEWVEFFSGETCVSYYQNIPIPIGSVVDAYTPDGIHCGTAYVTTAGEYNMTVYGDDPRTTEKDGAYMGEMISFYINGYPANATGDVTWTGAGPMKEVCLDLFTVNEVVIHLDAGWNLISWNVDTPDDFVETIFGEIMDDVEVILGFEQGGFTYDPLLPDFSTLGDCDHLHGFWVNMAAPRTLVIHGSPVSETAPIALEMGWNLVSYLPNTEYEPAFALGSVHDMLDVAMGWYAGSPETYDPTLPEYASMTMMRPTYGYWLNMESAASLVYPGEGPIFSLKQSLHKFDPAVARNGIITSRLWVDAYGRQLTLDGMIVSGGTEITAVTSDGRVVGAGTIQSNGKFGFMPIYGDDPITETIEGPSSGETVRFVIGGIETEETFVWNSEHRTIELSALTSKGGSDDPILPDQYGLYQNYPNPFNPTTTISFSIPSASQVTLEVYNVLGEKVATIYEGMAGAGVTAVVWDGRSDNGELVASGIYFSRMKSGQFEETCKMVLMK